MTATPPSAPPAPPTPTGWLKAVRWGAAGAALLVAGFGAGYYTAAERALPRPMPDLGAAPGYMLTNQLGQPVSSTRFAGKVQVVTFLFPYCTTYCPLIAAHLIGFERFLARAGQQDRVALVAFNVAPEVTGPTQMREFLNQYGWDPNDPHWQFLTGSSQDIHDVVTRGFHVAYQRVNEAGDEDEVEQSPDRAPQLAVANPLAEKVKPDFDISHNDAIELVDAKGRIRKIYDDADVVSYQQLWNDLQPLLAGER